MTLPPASDAFPTSTPAPAIPLVTDPLDFPTDMPARPARPAPPAAPATSADAIIGEDQGTGGSLAPANSPAIKDADQLRVPPRFSVMGTTPLNSFLLVAVLAAGSVLGASDLEVNDLRLGVGALSRDFKGDSTTTLTNSQGNVGVRHQSSDGRDADRNWRGQLQYVRGHLGAGGGLIWGVGVAVDRASWDNGNQEATMTTPVADLIIGYGYALASSWHFELTPFAGVGRSYYSVNDNNTTATSKDWSRYVEYGAKLGTYVALNEAMVLGVEIPYLVGRTDPEYNYTDSGNRQVTVKDERKNAGFGLMAVLGVRF